MRRPARIAVSGAAGAWPDSGEPATAQTSAKHAKYRMNEAPSRAPLRLRGVRRGDLAASLPGVLVEPAHHVKLRPDVVRGLGAGPVILLVELQQLDRHSAHLQRRVIFLGLRHGGPPIQ